MAGNSILWNNCSSNDSQHRSTVFWWAYFAKFSTPSKDSWEDQFLSLKKRPRCSLVFPKNWLQNLQLLWAWSVLSATSIIQSRNCGIFCYIHQKFYAHTNERQEGEFATSPMCTKLVTSFATLIHPKQGSNCQQKIWWPKADYLRGILDLIEHNPATAPRPVLIKYRHFWMGFRYL